MNIDTTTFVPKLSAATADLVSRFIHTVEALHHRPEGQRGLFDALRLDLCDWRLDHGSTQPVATPLSPLTDEQA